MKKELFKHKLAYFTLILFLLIFTLAFMAAWPNRLIQRVIIVAIAVFYFAWGVITHVKSEHISRRIVFEYAGVSILASVMLLLVTF